MSTTKTPHSVLLRRWLLWTAGFIALPLGGLAGSTIVGRVDDPAAALVGGTIVGLFLGTGQTLTSSHRLRAARWVPATAVGMSAGLLIGSAAVGYRTSLTDLVLMGAINGLVLGVAQCLALPRGTRTRWVWAAMMPVLWALGWSVTTLAGVRVDEQFIVFGASGALVVAALSGLLLHRILPPRQEVGLSPSRPMQGTMAP